MDETPRDLAVYIHWPYCTRICPYCDFNVYKRRQDEGLIAAIVQDLSYWRKLSGERNITSIHFGGGTPSLLKIDSIRKIIEQIQRLWQISDDMEVAIEANPNDCCEQDWQKLAEAGINRVSLGVQTFNDSALKFLGRDHSAKTAQQALDLAVKYVSSVSLDLIFGWAGQTLSEWHSDIQKTLDSGAPHISAYQLTIEDGTAFGRMAVRGEQKSVDDDQSAELYESASQAFTGAGYQHYEVSNFAKPGHRSRHNMTYWQGGDYAGVGPGAHGRLMVDGRRLATISALKPATYKTNVTQTGHGIDEQGPLSSLEWAEEYVLMGLRIRDGISLIRFEELAGQALHKERLKPLIKSGFLEIEGDRLFATQSGRPVLNYITEKLLVG